MTDVKSIAVNGLRAEIIEAEDFKDYEDVTLKQFIESHINEELREKINNAMWLTNNGIWIDDMFLEDLKMSLIVEATAAQRFDDIFHRDDTSSFFEFVDYVTTVRERVLFDHLLLLRKRDCRFDWDKTFEEVHKELSDLQKRKGRHAKSTT